MSVKSLGIIGVGAFGEFMIRHLAPYFRVHLYDAHRNLSRVGKTYSATLDSLEGCAACDIVVLAVPVQILETVSRQIALSVRPGSLILDVCSVKVKPADMLCRSLPGTVDIVCTHPLFGPQSGQRSIAGLKITVCDIRGHRGPRVAKFLSETLHLEVIETTPERHDKELAYVQGLTHLLGKILVELDLKDIKQTTKTFDLMMEAVSYMQHDSLELFKAIEQENPFVAEAHARFFRTAERLEKELGYETQQK